MNFSASEDAFGFHDSSVFLHTLSMMLFGGFLAFCMEVAEFMVVTFASSLTLAIVGVVKVCKWITVWKNEKFTEKKFVKPTPVTSLAKMLVSRNFWEKSVRVSFSNFHTWSNETTYA